MPIPNQNQIQPTNPFGDLALGVQAGNQSGHQWAQTAASVAMGMEQIKNQQAQHKLMEDEFNFKVGKDMMDGYNKFASMPDSPLKKVRGQQWKDAYVQAGKLPEDKAVQWIAASNDPKIQKDWNELYDAMGEYEQGNPDGFKNVVTRFSKLAPTIDVVDSTFKDMIGKVEMARAMGAKIQAMVAPRETQAELGVQEKALKEVKRKSVV